MLETTSLHRELGGATTSYDNIARVLGLPKWHARFPFASIASSACDDIVRHGPAFAELAWPHRLGLGLAAFGCVLAAATRQYLQVRRRGLIRRWRRWADGRSLSKH
jgi:hypothetical protein